MSSLGIADALCAQNLLSKLRLAIFFDVLEEARKGPGITDTNRIMDLMDGRELLHRSERRLASLPKPQKEVV